MSTPHDVVDVPVAADRLIRPEDDGTDEEVWTPWLADLSPADVPRGHVLVVAPHPDDETLGAGGLVAAASMKGARVSVIACTDGEAASERPGLGHIRQRELADALGELTGGTGISPERLQLPDGGLWGVTDVLRDELFAHVQRADLVVGPWAHDGHPDHDAVGAVLGDLCRQLGRALWSYPVWAWHWGTPATFGAETLRTVTLPTAARVRKRKAMWCHRSQIDAGGDAVLTTAVRQHFLRPVETFVVERAP